MRVRASKFIDLHPYRTQKAPPFPFHPSSFFARRGYRRNDARNLLYTRCTYRRYRKKTCSGLHGRAQVGGVGKQRVLSRTDTFPGKLLHQFDSDPRVSLLARTLGIARNGQTKKNVRLRKDRFRGYTGVNFLAPLVGTITGRREREKENPYDTYVQFC